MKSIITFFFFLFCSLSQCAEMNENQEVQLLKSPLISNASSKNVNVSEENLEIASDRGSDLASDTSNLEEKIQNYIACTQKEEESRFSNFNGALWADENYMTKDRKLLYQIPSLKNFLAENFVEVTVQTKPIQNFTIKTQDHIDTILGSIYWYPHGENNKHAVVNIAGLQEHLHAVDDVEIKQRELLGRCLMHITQLNINQLEDSYLEMLDNVLPIFEGEDGETDLEAVDNDIGELPEKTIDQDSSENKSTKSKLETENRFLKEQLLQTQQHMRETNTRNVELELKLLNAEKQLRDAQDKIRNAEDLELDLKTKQIQHSIAMKKVQFNLSNSAELSRPEKELKKETISSHERREKIAWGVCAALTLSTSYLLYKNWTKQ